MNESDMTPTTLAAALAAQVAELTAERDRALAVRDVLAGFSDAAEAKVAELTRDRDGWRAQHDRLLAESAKCFDAQSEIDQAWDAIGTAGNKQILTLPEQISALCRDYDARAEAAEAKLKKAVDCLRYYAVEAMPWDQDDSLQARTTLDEIGETK